MRYITLAEMCKTIRDNFYKVPHDVDFVIGIPRSGVICASIISEFLNCPLIDIDSFCFGAKPTGGGRLRYFESKNKGEKKKVLVVDDTVFTGESKKRTKEQLKKFEDEYEFIFLVVYLEGYAKDTIDIYLEDVSSATNGYRIPVLYEWNIFHHNEPIMKRCIYDIDGVFCVNPPDERDEEAYMKYIKDATPLFIPTAPIGEIMTYRLVKNQAVTEEWLKKWGIKCNRLLMFNAQSWDERNKKGISSEDMKGMYYKEQAWAILFVESDDYQARRIFEISGKPVYCVESNKLYSK